MLRMPVDIAEACADDILDYLFYEHGISTDAVYFHGAQTATVILTSVHPSHVTVLFSTGFDKQLGILLKSSHVTISKHDDGIAITINLPRELWYDIPLSSALVGGKLIPIGVDTLGNIICIDPQRKTDGHWLIAGSTQQGKTVMTKNILCGIATRYTPDELSLILFDGKPEPGGVSLFYRLPHLAHPAITDINEIVAALLWINEEIDNRKFHPSNKRIMVILDEFEELISATGGGDGVAAKLMARIARLGAGYGVHIIATVQNANVKTLGSPSLKNNFTSRIVFRVSDASASVSACNGGHGAHMLLGAGDALIIRGPESKRFRSFLPDEKIIQSLPYSSAPIPRLQMPELETETTEDDRRLVEKLMRFNADQQAAAIVALMNNNDIGQQSLRDILPPSDDGTTPRVQSVKILRDSLRPVAESLSRAGYKLINEPIRIPEM